ncbi:MAG TPA: rhomboid family intramembrane serine protease [Bacteroidia bacterium]|jgi:membrane associated rhomboid family serine protease|nr:rhomboid family intramembrane serine protease [Bacteroidia bacterium]
MITTTIIAACIIFSLIAFNNNAVFEKYLFSSYAVTHYKQYYRIFTHAFLHGDYMHLAFNMYALYLFGDMLEQAFSLPQLFGTKGPFLYSALYLGGIIFSSLPDLALHKNNSTYRSVGASGAVNAIVFSSILINPTMGMGLLFLPFFIPAWVFGGLYLAYSWYMSKRGGDNIGHNAHFYGALFGFLFTIVLRPSLFMNFINAIFHKG